MAYSLLPAQVAQPLNFIWPITLVLLSIPILKQKLKLKSLFALMLSFVGVIWGGPCGCRNVEMSETGMSSKERSRDTAVGH